MYSISCHDYRLKCTIDQKVKRHNPKPSCFLKHTHETDPDNGYLSMVCNTFPDLFPGNGHTGHSEPAYDHENF